MGRASLEKSFDFDNEDAQSFRSLDLEEAKAMLQEEPEQRASIVPRKSQRLKNCIHVSSITGNLILFALLLTVLGNPCYFSSRQCQYPSKKDGDGLQLLSQEHGLVPEFGLEKVTFMNDSRYANEDMFTNAEEYERILLQWEQDMPLGRGFVAIPDEGAKLLPNPYHLRVHPEMNGYSIASLHQFHCIYMIMKAMGDRRFDRPNHNADMERHVTHCFDYLRQSAQCAGDAALEGVSQSVNRMTDGWGNTHVCKKNNELFKWVTDNRLSDYTGIH